VLSTGLSETDVTFGRSALEGTEQVRPDTTDPLGSVAAHLAFGGQGRRRNSQRKDRDFG